jgi:hypothetical protein
VFSSLKLALNLFSFSLKRNILFLKEKPYDALPHVQVHLDTRLAVEKLA